MPDCECLINCPYFKSDILKEMDVILELRQQKYCRGDNSICAQYMVFKALGREHVPKTLLPSQVEKAKEIIEQNTPKDK